jgi:hypothetical protein
VILFLLSGLGFVIYLPMSALATLGLLAVWNRFHPPKLWQVLAVTAGVCILPWLYGSYSQNEDISLGLLTGLFVYVPVLIPAVLWALQRRGSDGEFSQIARRSGSLLVAYIVLVVLVIPAGALALILFA